MSLGKIRDKYQAYYTMYKTHAMATHHGGTGHPIDKDINLHVGIKLIALCIKHMLWLPTMEAQDTS